MVRNINIDKLALQTLFQRCLWQTAWSQSLIQQLSARNFFTYLRGSMCFRALRGSRHTVLITSTVLPAVSALFQQAFPCPDPRSQIPEYCNGVALSEISDQEWEKGCRLWFVFYVFMRQNIRFSILCIHMQSLICMTAITKERKLKPDLLELIQNKQFA